MPYIGKSPTGSGVRTRYYFTATGGETSLSGADDGGKTLTFSDGEYVDVYLNGIALVAGTDYGTATANTIGGLAALSGGDIVEVVVYDIYNVAKINSEAVRTRHYYTATGGETSIGTAQIPGLSFSGGTEIEVSLNGISLVQGTDYNTTAANTVGGLSALSAGNVVAIVLYEKFQLADTVSKAQGGTFGGAIAATSFTGDGSGLTGVSAGKVLQVVSTDVTAAATITSTSTSDFADMTGVSASITPASTSSKILVLVNCFFAASTGTVHFRLLRDSTAIRIGDAGGSNQIRSSIAKRVVGTLYTYYQDSFSISAVDSPSTTSAVTYKLQGTLGATYSGSIYLNKGNGDLNQDYASRGATNITLVEISS
jgi:hypothetical protein